MTVAHRIKSNAGAGRAEAALRVLLPATASMTVVGAHDSLVDVKVAGRRLRVVWAGEGWRRDIDPVIEKHDSRIDVVAARRMSAGGRAALNEAGIGWVDELGNAEVAIGSLLISRTGLVEHNEPPIPKWTPAVVAVTEALLLGTSATVSAIQGATGLSTGSCTNALRTLTELGYLEAATKRGRGSARNINDVDALLDAYANAAPGLTAELEVNVGVTWRDTIEGVRTVGKKWDEVGIEWAATGTVAGALTAPLLTNVSSAVVYVNQNTVATLNAAATTIDLKPLDGGRLTLRPFPTVTTSKLSEIIEDVKVAPWPRVYVDLRTTGVRGEEAADHLREVKRGR